MMAAAKWEHNCWTGHDILRVSKNERVIRQPFGAGKFLYQAEFWGDYSLDYPKEGTWQKSLPKARAELKHLKGKAR